MVLMMMTMMMMTMMVVQMMMRGAMKRMIAAISLRILMKAWPTTTGCCQGQTEAAKPLFLQIFHSDQDRHGHRHYLVKEL